MIRRIDRYELLEQVGTGGMSVVYRGRDTALDREVAVKLLHPHLATRPESRARFSREARAVARLSHPGIVEIYDYSGDDDRGELARHRVRPRPDAARLRRRGGHSAARSAARSSGWRSPTRSRTPTPPGSSTGI